MVIEIIFLSNYLVKIASDKCLCLIFVVLFKEV